MHIYINFSFNFVDDPPQLPKYEFEDLYSNKYQYNYLYPNWDESSEF